MTSFPCSELWIWRGKCRLAEIPDIFRNMPLCQKEHLCVTLSLVAISALDDVAVNRAVNSMRTCSRLDIRLNDNDPHRLIYDWFIEICRRHGGSSHPIADFEFWKPAITRDLTTRGMASSVHGPLLYDAIISCFLFWKALPFTLRQMTLSRHVQRDLSMTIKKRW